MIQLFQNNNMYLITINSFKNADLINMKKIISNIINDSLNKCNNVTIFVDVYDLKEYSLINVYKLIIFNNQFKIENLKFIKNIELFINIINKNKILEYIKNICPININLNYIKHKKKWDKIFKEY